MDPRKGEDMDVYNLTLVVGIARDNGPRCVGLRNGID